MWCKELPLVALAAQEKIGLFHRGFPFPSGLMRETRTFFNKKRIFEFIEMVMTMLFKI
jgi:hypothetical protein